MSNNDLGVNEQQWGSLQKISFRFIFLLMSFFIIYYTILFYIGTFPLLTMLLKYPIESLQAFIYWGSKQFLGINQEISYRSNGSGDRLFDYTFLLFILLFSLFGTLIWTVVDRKRNHYRQLYYWLTVAVRFYVGIMLINYGLAKVFKTQFPSPGLLRLTQNYGDSSPMGLAWAFIGFSKGYNLFIGFAELLAGLLFFRKTITIGALLSLMTTANIMAINYFYDVPVKILSTSLFLLCLFLLTPNFKSLFLFFFKGETTSLKEVSGIPKRKWMYGVKYALILLMLSISYIQEIGVQHIYGFTLPKPPLYGAYLVDRFEKNKVVMLDGVGWRLLLIGGKYESGIRYINDELEYGQINVDTISKKIAIKFINSDQSTHSFNYSIPDPDHLILKGKLYNDSVTVELTKKEFELTKRGFNWISELPYNR
ncbi:MAG: hypothetical protein P0Y49_05255 [Candidatus Pedobacter colombiensis]|uniref:DoxX family protein n=1 Tax=Candidatus Pedobacter colombiensis TaxID=3121371 RepID=A0AAJ5W9S4_9SPHI|nr:hypothetical protein [Pedobacter sp.]WEK20544.1 MAG: hypothetical protein P0Y49_05255 [Pedobacter sp.]